MLSSPRPLRVALLCSHRAPGLEYLLERDPNHGSLYELVCCLASEEGFTGQEAAERRGIPCLVHPIRRFYRRRGRPLRDLSLRPEFDAETAERLSLFRPDLVVLSSYLYVLTGPMLAAYADRIVNVHHGDLTVLNGDGRPRYVGLRAVREAIVAGEEETRATTHVVTEALDEGPPLLRSWPFQVAPLVREALEQEAVDVVKAYAYAHQEWMIRGVWGPLLARSIELLATDRVRLARGLAWIDGTPGPWDLAEDGTLRGREPAMAAAAGG